MKTTLGALSLFFALASLAAANLPDEINYRPYYDSYVDTKAERDDASNRLEAQESKLGAIVETIGRQLEYAASLERQIREYDQRINNLRRMIPEAERNRDAAERELSRSESEISSLSWSLNRKRDELERERRRLEPIQRELRSLGAEITRQNQRLSRLKTEQRNHQSAIRSAEDAVRKLTSENQSLASRLRDLQGKEGQYRSEINSRKQKLSSVQGQLRQSESKLQAAKAKVGQLNGQLASERATLSRLRSSGAEPAQIAAQERKVQQAQNSLNSATRETRSLESQTRGLSSQASSIQKEISQIEGNLRDLPRAISQAKAKVDSNNRSIANNEDKARKARNELTRVGREISQMDRNIDNMARRHAGLDRQQSDMQRVIDSINGEAHRLEGLLASENNRASGLRNRIASLSAEIRSMTQEIPQLQGRISRNETEIMGANATIANLRLDEGETRSSIKELEARLAQLESDTVHAYAQYEQRKDLYENYLAQAKELGAAQTTPASELGKEEGAAMALVSAAQLGQAMGSEEGRAQARLLGFVRGEIQGYPLGYDQGVNSQDSQAAGAAKGGEQGKSAVYDYVRANLKPGYFEEHMRELLKRPVALASMKSRPAMEFALEKSFHRASASDVADLMEAELAQSRRVRTPLDERIEKELEQVEQLQKSRELRKDPALAYGAPASIPYGEAACVEVYKGLEVYEKTCQTSYAAVFKSKFLAAVEQAFYEDFTAAFEIEYDIAQRKERNELYEQRFSEAQDIAFAQGEADGKSDAYDDAYASAYEIAYAQNLEPAKSVADEEAQREGLEWIESNPILGVAGYHIAAKNLRGGSKGELVVDLKNIASVASLASGMITIVESENAHFAQKTFKLDPVQAKSVRSLAFPFVVPADARSGEQARIKARLTLPGDKYQGQRVETIELSERLSVNPGYAVDLNYDASPKVKGLFSYYIHKFSVKIRPAIEDLEGSYSVRLSAAAEQAELVDFKVAGHETQVLAHGEEQQLDFSYVFALAARGKSVKLKLEVFYQGEALDAQVIELYPH